MHQIEIGNKVETHRLIIIDANRETLALDLFGHVEEVTTSDYVTFARALTSAYHELEGSAELVDKMGKAIFTLTFNRGRVDVRIVRANTVRTFQTDQSYVTPMLAQIGIIE